MKKAPIPDNEESRLISLHNLGLLDTKPEERFDVITRTATKIFNVPISTITLVDAKREWFKSVCGLEQTEGDRAISFCGHALLVDDVFVVPDTKEDERFADNPMVIGKPFIRFYAGVPVVNVDGQRVGVFCIKDVKPRVFSKDDENILLNLSKWAELEINSRNLSLALEENGRVHGRLKLATESSKIGIWEWDIVHNVLEWDDLMYKLYGIKKEDFSGVYEAWQNGLHPEDKERGEKELKEALEGDDKPFNTTFRVIWPDKSIHYIRGFGHVERDSEGKAVKVLGVNFDVTEEKKIEQDTLEAKAKDEAILSSIGDGVVATDKDGKIMFVNQAAADLLLSSTKDFLGKPYLELIVMVGEDGKKVPDLERPMTQVIKTGKKFTTTTTTTTTTFQYVRSDKSCFPVALTVTPIVLDGKLIGTIEIFRDITKEKEIDKAKTEFVSLASHQLRTPLSAINWYTEMLMSGDAGELNEGQKNFLDEVYQGSRRMVELVNALLNVSRIDLGTFDIEPEKVDLVKLIQNVADEQRVKIKEGMLDFVFTYDRGKSATVSTDPKLLRMVFQNLLSNSVKYTPQGGKIEVSLSSGGEESVGILFSDTGYGIPKDQQSKIFSKLFRADNVVDKDTEGTGLGLYIVKAVIGQLGGTISFESVEDRGTTFSIGLPVEINSKKSGGKSLSWEMQK